MIDIHTHILPGVDDGASNWEESLAMIQQGIEDGIKGIVCTSHVVNRLDGKTEQNFIIKFRQLKERIREKGFNISLWLGSEILCQAKFDVQSQVATLNGNGKFLLLELPLGSLPVGIGEIFFQLSLEGIVPILAHPERNTVILQKPSIAFEFVRRGVLLQINAGSLMGHFGKKIKRFTYKLMDHHLVHFVASDCHSPWGRPMRLSGAYKVIKNRWGKHVAEDLMRINPRKAVLGEEITPPISLPFDEQRSRWERFLDIKIFSKR